MALTPEARARIAQLLPMLASPHDGEVAATARAIGRVLAAAAADWHDLAKAVAHDALAEAVADVLRPPSPSSRASSASASTGFARDIYVMLVELNNNFDDLTDWERGFVRTVSRNGCATFQQAAKIREIFSARQQKRGGL